METGRVWGESPHPNPTPFIQINFHPYLIKRIKWGEYPKEFVPAIPVWAGLGCSHLWAWELVAQWPWMQINSPWSWELPLQLHLVEQAKNWIHQGLKRVDPENFLFLFHNFTILIQFNFLKSNSSHLIIGRHY